MTKTKNESSLLIEEYGHKQYNFANMSKSSMENNINEIGLLQEKCEKTKNVLCTMIQRIQDLEMMLDYRIETNRMKASGELVDHQETDERALKMN